MEISAARRVKAVREMLGMTRPAFCELVGIEFSRMATLEHDRARMSVEELALIDNVLPEFTTYLLHGKVLDLIPLATSANETVKFVGMRLKNGEIPAGYGLEKVIVNGSQSKR
jgi:transcriptional regulator with XRE-family HTH domain